MRAPVVLCCALALCTCAAAQSGSWAAVQGLAPGSPVESRLASGVKLKGKLLSVSASGMDLRTSQAIRYISRTRVRTLFLAGRTHKLRNAWVGFAIGEAGGAFVGAINDNGDCGPPPPPADSYGYNPCQRIAGAAAVGAVFGLFGAAAGALTGLVRSHRVLVYQRGPGGNNTQQKAARRRIPSPTQNRAGR
ncbi:MAG: hypothetical protein ACRD17_14125 [Terriglobales bacterium]